MALVQVTAPDGSRITITPEFLGAIVTEISEQASKLSFLELVAYAGALKMTPAQIIGLVRGVKQCRS